MRIFFSVGEPSGDLHGANLVQDLKRRSPQTECVGFGGPKMSAAGCELQFDLTSLAVMGFWQAVFNLRKFFRLLSQAEKSFAEHRPDAVVLIDYPGFNWWIARKAKRHGIPVFYYGVPQMWAWGRWRIKKLRKLVDYVLCKLPFEADWFQQRGCDAVYVGHPYFDEIGRRELDASFLQDYQDDSRLLVLLPGSRTQEVRRTLGWLLDAAEETRRHHPDLAVAIACLKPEHAAMAELACRQRQTHVDVFVGKTAELISIADVCLSCSGSVSLELLHYRKPTVIVYRIGLTLWIAQFFLLKTKYITLVNLLAADNIERTSRRLYDPDADDAQPVPMPEYVRVSNCSKGLSRWATRWLGSGEQRQAREAQLAKLADQFGQRGASQRAAQFILEKLGNQSIHQQDHSPEIRRAA